MLPTDVFAEVVSGRIITSLHTTTKKSFLEAFKKKTEKRNV